MNADVIRLVAEDRLTDRTRAELFEEALGARRHRRGAAPARASSSSTRRPSARGFFVDTGFPGLEGRALRGVARHRRARPRRCAGLLPNRCRRHRSDDTTRGRRRPDLGARRRRDAAARRRARGRVRRRRGRARAVRRAVGARRRRHQDRVARAIPTSCVMGSGRVELINKSFAFNAECRGRRSVALDLTTERGRELALASVRVGRRRRREPPRRRARPARPRLRRDPRAATPASSTCRRRATAAAGRSARCPPTARSTPGFSGVHLLWNHPDAPYPCGTSMNHPDHIAGEAARGRRARRAARTRARSGEGQWLEIAQTEAAAYLIGEVYLEAAPTRASTRSRSATQTIAARRTASTRAAGDDQWVAIAVIDDDAWRRLSRLAGWPDDPSLAHREGRLAAREAIDERLAVWTAERTAEVAAARLQVQGISAMPVMGPLDQHADPHLIAGGVHRPTRAPRGRSRAPRRQPRALLAAPVAHRAAAPRAWAPTRSRSSARSWASPPMTPTTSSSAASVVDRLSQPSPPLAISDIACSISSGLTSRTWVWIDHRWPNGSSTTAARSP